MEEKLTQSLKNLENLYILYNKVRGIVDKEEWSIINRVRDSQVIKLINILNKVIEKKEKENNDSFPVRTEEGAVILSKKQIDKYILKTVNELEVGEGGWVKQTDIIVSKKMAVFIRNEANVSRYFTSENSVYVCKSPEGYIVYVPTDFEIATVYKVNSFYNSPVAGFYSISKLNRVFTYPKEKLTHQNVLQTM